MITAIVQARMGSTRLPGKVMKLLSGKPMLWHIIDRLKFSKKIDRIIIATTVKEDDKVIVKLSKEIGIDAFSGSPEDVLDRYYQSASFFNVKHIIRITADCPLIDPVIVDETVDYYQKKNCDYVSNTINPSYPDGLDTEIFSFETLERAWGEAVTPSEREHVTPYIYNHSEIFKIYNYANDVDRSHMRWVVDEAADYKFIAEVYKRLYREGEIFYMNDVLDLLSKHPELNDINKNIKRNEGYMKSLEYDNNMLLE